MEEAIRLLSDDTNQSFCVAAGGEHSVQDLSCALTQGGWCSHDLKDLLEESGLAVSVGVHGSIEQLVFTRRAVSSSSQLMAA